MQILSQNGMAVHPRKCGECHELIVGGDHAVGSSPQVRGVRSQLRRQKKSTAVHPRKCGECAFKGNPGLFTNSVHPRKCGECTLTINRKCAV